MPVAGLGSRRRPLAFTLTCFPSPVSTSVFLDWGSRRIVHLGHTLGNMSVIYAQSPGSRRGGWVAVEQPAATAASAATDMATKLTGGVMVEAAYRGLGLFPSFACASRGGLGEGVSIVGHDLQPRCLWLRGG